MTPEGFRFLLSAPGQATLREMAATPITAATHLPVSSRLRRRLPAEKAQAVVETLALRQKAAAKFSRADEMYFSRAALEQASAEIVANYRAERFFEAGFEAIADLGCGIGGDALALAAAATVVGIERDGLRLAMARENMRAYGRGDRFRPLQADLLALPPLPLAALFFDPARRDARGRRLRSVHDYQPPLALLDRWRPAVAHAAVKLGPAVDLAELPAVAEVEFISVRGELREAVLWTGDLRSGASRQATLLPGAHSLTASDASDVAVPLSPPQAYLLEPDAAVIRAGLVRPLAARLGASQIDASIAYLTAARASATPFARYYEVEEVLPFQLKRLRQALRQRGIGQVTIKKRGSPLEVEALRRQLRLRGERHCTLFLTQLQGKATAILAQPVAAPG